jgi:hypothetical protein
MRLRRWSKALAGILLAAMAMVATTGADCEDGDDGTCVFSDCD